MQLLEEIEINYYHLKRFNPVTSQIGGSNPNELAEACKISEDYGYKEII